MYKGAPVSPGIVRAGAMGLVGEQPGGGKEEQAREMLGETRMPWSKGVCGLGSSLHPLPPLLWLWRMPVALPLHPPAHSPTPHWPARPPRPSVSV